MCRSGLAVQVFSGGRGFPEGMEARADPVSGARFGFFAALRSVGGLAVQQVAELLEAFAECSLSAGRDEQGPAFE
jgi:hypothetical protein